jgi:hypothetical protein
MPFFAETYPWIPRFIQRLLIARPRLPDMPWEECICINLKNLSTY